MKDEDTPLPQEEGIYIDKQQTACYSCIRKERFGASFQLLTTDAAEI